MIISALKRFFSSYDDNLKKVMDFFSEKDWENYRITVHALKSNSKMVGAMALSEGFEQLEDSAREGNISFIESENGRILEEYKKVVELIRPIGEADVEPPADEIDSATAREVSGKLLDALDDFDDELSLELAKKLSGYPFRITQKEELNKAIRNIQDFCYDDAADIIRKITEEIE